MSDYDTDILTWSERHFLSHEHKITATTKVRCETDEQAIAEARNTADGRGVVILQDNRCVDTIEGSGS